MKFRKAGADEARAKRRTHAKEANGDLVVMKGFKAPPSFDKTNRSAKFVMSSETVDRYGDIVVQNGLDTTRFMENPQALLFHNSRSWPCGNWSDVVKVLGGRPKRTEGVLNFLPEGADPDADRAVNHVAAGTLRTVSIGFQPNWEDIEFILDDDEDWTGGFRYNSSEMLECSLVPIPAQPDALVKSATGDMVLARDLIEDVLENYAKTPEGLLVPIEEYRAKYLDLGGNPHSVLLGATSIIIKDGAVSIDDVRKAMGLPGLPAVPKAASEDDPEMDVDPEDPDDDPDEEDASKAAAEASWSCKASRDLALDEDAAWDGAAAKKAMLDDAGIGGDSPDHAKAARGFLAVDTANPDLRKSYKLPFATIIGGDLKALASGIRAAASRVPNTDVPDAVKDDAKAAIAAYEANMTSDDDKAVKDEAKAFADFLAKAVAGDTFSTFFKLEGDKATEKGVMLHHNGEAKTSFEFKDKVRKQHREMIAARMTELAAPKEPVVEPTSKSIVIDIDVEPVEKKLNSISALADAVGAKLAKIFGTKEVPERVEPVIVEPKTVEPVIPAPIPTEDEMAAVIAKASATSQRLVSTGLIEA